MPLFLCVRVLETTVLFLLGASLPLTSMIVSYAHRDDHRPIANGRRKAWRLPPQRRPTRRGIPLPRVRAPIVIFQRDSRCHSRMPTPTVRTVASGESCRRIVVSRRAAALCASSHAATEPRGPTPSGRSRVLLPFDPTPIFLANSLGFFYCCASIHTI